MTWGIDGTLRGIFCRAINEIQLLRPFSQVEDEIISDLSKLTDCRLIISGYHRRASKNENLFIKTGNTGRYVAVANLLDGEENFFRGSDIYGASLSLTCVESGEHFAVVYDCFSSKILEFPNTGIEIDYENRNNALHYDQGRAPRNVFACGRVFPLGERAMLELNGSSIRSFGSTTASILEMMRGHIDLYTNITKIWNIWWALWLSNQNLQFEEITTGQKILDQIQKIIINPEKSLALLCYRDISVKQHYSSTLSEFSKYCID